MSWRNSPTVWKWIARGNCLCCGLFTLYAFVAYYYGAWQTSLGCGIAALVYLVLADFSINEWRAKGGH